MEQSTQETQIASQTYSQRPDDPADDSNCWGLLWPLVHKGTARPAPWRFNLDKKEYTIGRSNSCDVKIASQIISNTHCVINWDGVTGPRAGITITDVSRNGTFVKGSKIAKNAATLLHDGDEVAFGVPGTNQSGESHRYTFRTPVVLRERTGIHVNYELQQDLGSGSFATVVKALHRRTGQFVAVKVIPRPKSLLQPNTVKMLEREMSILQSLDHPNIVKLYEVVPTDVQLCLVMELVSGGDLFDYIVNRGNLSEEQSGHFSAQLCDAMAYIHYQGITHRDLKPENILLTMDNPPNIKVADFGLAKCVNSQTMLRTMCGTPSYLAPEVVLQDANGQGYDHKVDSWSAGAIIFAMLTGQGAFAEDENQGLRHRVTTRKVQWSFMTDIGCSPESVEFVNQLLQFDPVRRASLAESLGHAWLYPRFWSSGVPSYMQPEEELPGRRRSGSFAGSVMSAPGGTPMTGVSEEFQALDLDYESSESPAMVDFDDASVGGPSDMSRSQEIRAQLEQREQSWDILNDEIGDPEQTPLARPRINLPPEEHTPRPRPPIITNVQELPGPTRPKRKLSSGDDLTTPGGVANNTRLGARKASKASQYDTPATATRQKFPNGALPNDRKTSLRGKGKGPVARDFIDGEE